MARRRACARRGTARSARKSSRARSAPSSTPSSSTRRWVSQGCDGPNCATWPSVLTENPYQRPKRGRRFGPTLCELWLRRPTVDRRGTRRGGVPGCQLRGARAAVRPPSPAADSYPLSRNCVRSSGRYLKYPRLHWLTESYHPRWSCVAVFGLA